MQNPAGRSARQGQGLDDDLYNPLDVILLDRYTPFDPPGYLHNSTFFVILRASLLGAFFMFCGVLFLTGQFS